jgi:hypothetical protein
MNDFLFPRRLTRRDFPASAGGAAARLAQHKGFLDTPDLASRASMLDAHDSLAAQLGDGKETDGKTNPPVHQTNPALFAAPHSLSLDFKGNLHVVQWIPTGRPRQFKPVPA